MKLKFWSALLLGSPAVIVIPVEPRQLFVGTITTHFHSPSLYGVTHVRSNMVK